MSIIDNLAKIFPSVKSEQIGGAIEDLVGQAVTQRRKHERRWYDNNFFDDGYHFRVISRKTGRVIDTIGKLTGFVERAIPRASLQIRGVSNLLWSADPYPVVYPERVTIEKFRSSTGQIDIEGYKKALELNKQVARKRGIWLTNEWEDCDLEIKLIDMMILAAKNAISYLKIYSDPDKQEIKTVVRDAFDVIVYGDRRNLKIVPFVTDTEAMDIRDVQTDTRFVPAMVAKLQPDNKYATSEIKDAYMRSRFGTKTGNKEQATIIIKETFMKEYLTDDNWQEIVKKTQNTNGLMDGKSRGDMVMRHPFSAGGVTLADEYVDYDEYPYAYFRFEPGPLYQVPFIERFIPQNKSLDIIMTRLEKWVNAMVVGIYQKRKGENFQISNFPGGQVVEYETTPLTQMNGSSVGNTPFNVVGLLDKYIEEQGASTSALSQIPAGVKSGNAIESLKASEYANLKIATKMLKKTIKTAAELMFERAHKDFMEPKEVEHLDDSEPYYFDIIGQKGYDLSQKVNKTLPPDIVPIRKDVKVRIEIEPGLGLTMEGKRAAMKDILTFLTPFTENGMVNSEALKIAIKKMMETYGFGSTQEFMEALELQTDNMDEETIQKIKIAVLETMKDAGVVGPEADNKMVNTTKVGVLESLKESGLLKNMQGTGQVSNPQVKITESISYKDAPPDIKRQIEKAAGLNPSTMKWEESQAKKNENAKKQVQNNA